VVGAQVQEGDRTRGGVGHQGRHVVEHAGERAT
jgi:hypothetical protein